MDKFLQEPAIVMGLAPLHSARRIEAVRIVMLGVLGELADPGSIIYFYMEIINTHRL